MAEKNKSNTAIAIHGTSPAWSALTAGLNTFPFEYAKKLPKKFTEGPCDAAALGELVASVRADWLVVLSEGALLASPERLEDLVSFAQQEGIDCVGMPDGGVVSRREGCPLVVNPFFLVLHAKKIRSFLPKKIPKESFQEAYRVSLSQTLLRGPFRLGAEAPYSSFFYALHRNAARFLYLDAVPWVRDRGATILCDHLRRPFLVYPWETEAVTEQHARFLQAANFCRVVQEQLAAIR